MVILGGWVCRMSEVPLGCMNPALGTTRPLLTSNYGLRISARFNLTLSASRLGPFVDETRVGLALLPRASRSFLGRVHGYLAHKKLPRACRSFLGRGGETFWGVEARRDFAAERIDEAKRRFLLLPPVLRGGANQGLEFEPFLGWQRRTRLSARENRTSSTGVPRS